MEHTKEWWTLLWLWHLAKPIDFQCKWQTQQINRTWPTRPAEVRSRRSKFTFLRPPLVQNLFKRNTMMMQTWKIVNSNKKNVWNAWHKNEKRNTTENKGKHTCAAKNKRNKPIEFASKIRPISGLREEIGQRVSLATRPHNPPGQYTQ